MPPSPPNPRLVTARGATAAASARPPTPASMDTAPLRWEKFLSGRSKLVGKLMRWHTSGISRPPRWARWALPRPPPPCPLPTGEETLVHSFGPPCIALLCTSWFLLSDVPWLDEPPPPANSWGQQGLVRARTRLPPQRTSSLSPNRKHFSSPVQPTNLISSLSRYRKT